MTGSWERAKEIFHHAMGLPAEERAAWLHDACGDDAELRAEVDELLAAHDDAGSFLGDLDVTFRVPRATRSRSRRSPAMPLRPNRRRG